MRRACSCSARTLASVDFPTRIGPSITMWRGGLKAGSLTPRDYSKVWVRPTEVRCRSKRLTGSTHLPALGDCRDDVREGIYVARINHFRWGMRIAQRPAERNVHRAVADEGGAIIAAAGDAILNGNLICACELDEALDQRCWDDIGIVHGANHESFADFRIGETLRFDGRGRADESGHGENEIGDVAFVGEALGQFRGAHQAFFFAGGPDESDVAVFHRCA